MHEIIREEYANTLGDDGYFYPNPEYPVMVEKFDNLKSSDEVKEFFAQIGYTVGTSDW
jgi:hypothetical protein